MCDSPLSKLHLTTKYGIAVATGYNFSSCSLLVIRLYGLRHPAMAGSEVFDAQGES
jgi:hypothetical protein